VAVSVNKIRVNSLYAVYRAHRVVIFVIARLSCFHIPAVRQILLLTFRPLLHSVLRYRHTILQIRLFYILYYSFGIYVPC